MNKLSIILFVMCAYYTMSELILDSEWQAWKIFHNKKYKTRDEEGIRYAIWKENLEIIKRHNKVKHSFDMAMNHLGDLTSKEVKAMLNGYLGTKKNNARKQANSTNSAATFLPPSNVILPKHVDWREKGYVTPVKNQGACGSCWAFSTTGSLEGQHFKKTGKLVSLSEQNLVDCSGKFGNMGCEGGLMDYAFKYVKANHGIDTEKSYPYLGEDEQCHFKKQDVGATDTGYVDIKANSEKHLQIASATVGPISVGIDASNPSFQLYSKGVYDEPNCSSTQLDHGVLVVGYGVTDDGTDYWLVKNSWSDTWGMEGYIMMSRNKHNQCGIASNASYPLV